MVAATAIVLSLLTSAPDVLHAHFDGAQSGDLPAIVVDRPMAALQSDGTVVDPDQPRWGRPRATPDFIAGWTQVVDAPGAITLLLGGFDADDTTPLLGTLNANLMTLNLYLGERLGSGPTFEHSMRRIESDVETVDVLLGTPLQESDHVYRPRAGTVLPGCVVLLCQRSRRVEDPSLEWVAEGVSVIALEHVGDEWRWRIIGHVAPIGGDDRALGRHRIFASSMTNYFPDPNGVVDGRLVDAWIPFVDYLHHVPDPSTGGQCMLLRARRSDTGISRWTFEGPVLLHEFFSGTKRHTHAAAWTPNGVLLAIGDGGDSEVALLTCDKPDQWTDPTSWTTHHDIHGAPLADGKGGDVGANQFWSAAPGPSPNTVIVGGDNVSGVIFGTTIPADPADGIRFERLWGVQPGDIGDGGEAQCTCSLLHQLRPESGGPLLARFYLESPQTSASYARLLLSEDSETFATVGGLRPSGSKVSPIALHGTTMVTSPLTSQIESGLFTQPRPSLQVRRPLLLGPASVNELYRADMVGGLGIIGQEGVQIVEVPRGGGDPIASHAALAPGHSPVWRVARDGAGNAELASVMLPTPKGGWPEGPLWVQGWMSNLTAAMLRPEVRLDLGPHDVRRRVAIASELQWVPIELVTDADDPTMGASPTLELSLPGDGLAPPTDLLFTIASVTHGAPPPWPGAEPLAARTPERVGIPLPETLAPWTLELDLVLPEHSVDYGLGGRFDLATLATIGLVDGSVLEVNAEIQYARIYLDHIAPDGTRTTITKSLDVRMARLDTLRITLAAAVGAVGLEAYSGGRRKPIDRIQGKQFSTLAAINILHLGASDTGVQLPIEVLRVSLWPDEANIDVGIEWESGPMNCPADFDLDGVVGGSDVLILLTGWGACPTADGKDDPPPCIADLTQDGQVDIDDMLLLLTSLGECFPD